MFQTAGFGAPTAVGDELANDKRSPYPSKDSGGKIQRFVVSEKQSMLIACRSAVTSRRRDGGWSDSLGVRQKAAAGVLITQVNEGPNSERGVVKKSTHGGELRSQSGFGWIFARVSEDGESERKLVGVAEPM